MQGWICVFKNFFINKELIVKRKLRIEKIILENYEPYFYSVLDISEQHRGHQNFKENVESHFEIIIVSEKFKNIARIDRHRMVNRSLKEEFFSDLHSIIIKTFTIKEYKNI